MFSPCYVLDSRLHNKGSIGLQKWEPRSNIREYIGHSPFHAISVALIYNPSTGHVSQQYHVVFDDDFTMVPFMEPGMVPPQRSNLVHSSSELASKHVLNLSQAWLGSTGQDVMPVPVMYRADTGTGPKCINANAGMGTI